MLIVKKAAPVRPIVAKKGDFKINEEIRAKELRVIDPVAGTNNIMPLSEALKLAYDNETDLVQINDEQIPVAKLIDFDKFIFQQDKAKKNHTHVKKMKQIKFHYNIGENDVAHKVKHIRQFLEEKHNVQIICTFQGRENKYRQIGKDLFNHIIEQLKNVSKVDGIIKEDGNSIKMTLNHK